MRKLTSVHSWGEGLKMLIWINLTHWAIKLIHLQIIFYEFIGGEGNFLGYYLERSVKIFIFARPIEKEPEKKLTDRDE